MRKEVVNKSVKNSISSERGAALVMSIFALLLVTVLGFAMVGSSLVTKDLSTSAKQQSESYYIAEAGLNHAIELVKAAGASQFTNILQAGDGVANTGDELSTRPGNPIPAAGISLGSGSYKVFVKDDVDDADGDPNADSNGRLVITSIGTGSDGATATSEAVVYIPVAQNRIGLLADGDINVTNNLYVHGPSGSIHSNAVFSTNNPVCVENRVSHTSSASMNLSKITGDASCGTPGTVGVNVFYSQPRQTPEIHDLANIQAQFHPLADYIFKADGNIYRQASQVAMTPTEINVAGLGGWSYSTSAKLWSYSSGSVLPDATYYFEASNCKITNGGQALNPPHITLIGEGSILINNGPVFQPKLPGWALVSANDIAVHSQLGVSGNPGLVYAYGQLQVTNTTTIYGWVQAANFRRADGTNGADVDDVGGTNLVRYSSVGAVRISGITNIYTPAGSGGGSTNLTVISRREVRY